MRVSDPQRGGRDAYGATVRVTVGGRTLTQVAQSGHSYLCASDPRPLFVETYHISPHERAVAGG